MLTTHYQESIFVWKLFHNFDRVHTYVWINIASSVKSPLNDLILLSPSVLFRYRSGFLCNFSKHTNFVLQNDRKTNVYYSLLWLFQQIYFTTLNLFLSNHNRFCASENNHLIFMIQVVISRREWKNTKKSNTIWSNLRSFTRQLIWTMLKIVNQFFKKVDLIK